MTELNGTISLKDLLQMTDMNDATIVKFKHSVFGYCKENLVKLVVYLPSPYVTKLVVNEVKIGIYFVK